MASKSKSRDDQIRLAVLIDADNAQPSVIEGLLAEVAKYGVASAKRIYGDWTLPNLKQWKDSLNKHSISPMQQFAYTKGKNSTDSSLIIDAMDLMYTGRFDGFCLVSSDSDFTRLAQRLREGGMMVYGFGEKKTPDAFVQACDKFIYTEVLRAETATPRAATKVPRSATAKPGKSAAEGVDPDTATAGPVTADKRTAIAARGAAGNAFPFELVRSAIDDASDDSGWAHLSSIGSYLTKVRPDFDPRLYGQKKLSDLLRQHPHLFVLEERGSAGALYVRLMRKV